MKTQLHGTLQQSKLSTRGGPLSLWDAIQTFHRDRKDQFDNEDAFKKKGELSTVAQMQQL